MKITVLNVLDAHARAEEFDTVISVVDHPQMLWDAMFEHPHHIVEYFADEEFSTARNAPQKEHIERILNATADLSADANILVHCYAGQCRSTAMAIAIATQHGMDPLDAAVELYKNHHCEDFWPNKLILRYAAEILDDSRIFSDIVKWMRTLPKGY